MWTIEGDHLTGETTDSFVVVLTWLCSHLREKVIHLVNTHATRSLSFKLLAAYNDAQSAEKENILVPATVLAAGEDAEMQYEGQYHKLILQVKSVTSVATYEVNYQGQGA